MSLPGDSLGIKGGEGSQKMARFYFIEGYIVLVAQWEGNFWQPEELDMAHRAYDILARRELRRKQVM